MESVFRIVLVVVLFFVLTSEFNLILSHVYDRFRTVSAAHGKSESATILADATGGKSKSFNVRQRLVHTIKTSCLPKLICELNASPHKETLSEAERSLLSLIRDTSISTTAEVTSRYHFAAHMGQLIAGVDGTGCHNFYPSCPFPGLQVMSMMKKVQIR
ncbi:uncharacterized protein geko [Bemisia tabaci]|uniref:uncharacterized protein geko n=1 Tax=Bemisia tabaci TaxID=7038 RepID=UPI003B289856